MSLPASPPPERVPTLTEVIDVEAWSSSPMFLAVDDEPRATPPVTRSASPLPAEEQLVRSVLTELQHQIDVMLEYRVREVLGPVLARAADSVVRDARSELASTLRDVVARAVEAELARHRGR